MITGILAYLMTPILIWILYEGIRARILIANGTAIAKRTIAYQQNNPKSKTKILIVGDSSGLGVGAESPLLSVAGRFGKDYPKAHIVNLARNGQKIKELAINFNPENYKNYDLVLVHIGGNDILRFTPWNIVNRYIHPVLGKAKNASKNVILIHGGNMGIAPFFHRPLAYIFTYRTRIMRKILKRASKEMGAIYLDLFNERDEPESMKYHSKSYYATDKFHLSGKGYDVWYYFIRNAMRENHISL